LGRSRIALFAAAAFVLPVAVAAQVPPSNAQQSPPSPAGTPATPQTEVDRQSEAYYQFTMGRMYEERYEVSGLAEYAGRAIEAYKRAYELDVHSSVIGERLAEAYARAGRIPEAIAEAEGVLKQDPANLPARRILARIYVRSLGDMESSAGQNEIVEQAIAQYREIVRLDPADSEAELWLARLYRLVQQDNEAEEVLRAALAPRAIDSREPAPQGNSPHSSAAPVWLTSGQRHEVTALLASLVLSTRPVAHQPLREGCRSW